MATRSIYWAATKRILNTVAAMPSMVELQVEESYPGDEASGQFLCPTGDVEIEQSVPTTKAGRLQRDEVADIGFGVRLSQYLSADDVMGRLTDIISAVASVCVDDATLNGLDGVVSCTPSSQHLFGPSSTRNGWEAAAEVHVELHARIN